MEHIRQYDWCSSAPDGIHFLSAEALDRSVTEKILQNKFTNPLISSDSEEESRPENTWSFNWDQIFHRRNIEGSYHRTFVPGLRPAPAFPRLSALSPAQHASCLRVLCARNPHILPEEFMPRPNKCDLKVFEDVKEIYSKEQKEFMEWARSLWTSKHCVRALRPKPLVESVYEAEFKMRAHRMEAYPKVFEVVAQIPLDSIENCEIVLREDLIDVNISNLPQVRYPEKIDKRWTVLRPCSLPVPCEMHPVQLPLPGGSSVSVLPLLEVHRELAMYAQERGARFVASEGALRCLGERRAWTLPITVHSAPDGDTGNIIVLGSEFCNKRENVMTRTFKAYRHLLEFALVPASEREKMFKVEIGAKPAEVAVGDVTKPANSWMEPSSDDEDTLVIDFEEQAKQTPSVNKATNDDEPTSDNDVEMGIEEIAEQQKETEDASEKETHEMTEHMAANASVAEGFGVYTCTCKDTIYERPPPRSFKKYRIKNGKTSDHYDVIVHSAHKHKDSSGEVLLEPIIEYQADLGASKQCDDRIRSLALSLALRKNASLMNVRIDPTSGDVITFERHKHQQFLSEHSKELAAIAGSFHTAFDQLQGLVPGQYVMLHEPSHGENALLYAPRSTGAERLVLRLVLRLDARAAADDAAARAHPPLEDRLLPFHKFRKILPCAFTTYPNQIAREHKKQAPRQKTPPQALKWPKKKGRKKKTN